MEKGNYGYMKHRQDHNFRLTLLCAAFVLIFVVIGFIIWRTRMNLLMIPAVLCVLPTANFLVSYIAIAGYHTMPEELHQELKAYEDAGMLLSDMVIVDEKGRRFGMPFAVVYKNGVVGYMAKPKENKDGIEITVNDTLKRRGIPMRIKVYKDWGEFTDRLKEIEPVIEEDSARRVELAREAVLSVSM